MSDIGVPVIRQDILKTDESGSLKLRTFIRCPEGWQGYELDADRSRILIGTNTDQCDIIVSGPGIADVQVVMNLVYGQWYITECGTNGILHINGVKRPQIVLTQNNNTVLNLGNSLLLLNYTNVETFDVSNAYRSKIMGSRGYIILKDNMPTQFSLKKCVLIGNNSMCDIEMTSFPFAAIVCYDRGSMYFYPIQEDLDFTIDRECETADLAQHIPPNSSITIQETPVKIMYSPKTMETPPKLCILQIGNEVEEEVVSLPEPGGTLTMGRAPENNYVISSNRISRKHAAINMLENGVELVDAGSRNGVYLNGDKVTSSPVKPGDIIEMGNCRFVLCYED